ncbi:hypothetical protein AS850_10230 [Frondihabitans sp. 762G35]|nr:hypothetical protein AS850_10230 [Frondihabitans sp. 762G35]
MRLGWEALGVLLSAAFALIALAHALGTAKRPLLLSDADSVLLPLMRASFERGEPFEWGLSPVLFVFPELPLYLLSAAVTTTVASSLLLNGVLNVVILYGLFRAVASRVVASGTQDARPGPARPVVAALVGVAALTLLCLLETTAGGNTAELATLFLTTTYYSGTVMALVASLALALHVAAWPRARGAVRPARRGSLPWAVLGLALVAGLATLSNPLFALWATAPLGLALGASTLVRLRRARDRRMLGPLVAAAALVAGSVAGYLGRAPLTSFIIARQQEYLRWDGQATSIAFFGGALRDLVSTPRGVGELLLVLALAVASVMGAVRAVRRGRTDAAALVFASVSATIVLLPIALIWTGSISTRYAIPLVVAPLLGLVALVASTPRPRDVTARRGVAVVALAAVVSAVVVATPAAGRLLATGAGSGDTGAACLTDWVRDEHVAVAGATQFWTGRGLAAYAGPTVRLLQITDTLDVYPWLVNLAPYRGARVGYLIRPRDEPRDADLGGTVAALGPPRDVVACGTYDIYDYRGTAGEAILTERIGTSAEMLAALRGFGW